MANSLLTIGAVTKKALLLFRNSNAFLQSVDRQYDASFAQIGGKIGNQLRIRLPNDYTVRTGPTAVPQDTNEQNVVLTVATQKGVDVSFSSVDRALSLDDYGNRILAPQVNALAGAVATDIMNGVSQIPNLLHNIDGNGNTISPNFTTWATANGVLNSLGAPNGNRMVVIDPITESRTISSFSGLFNNQDKIGRQYTTGRMGTNVLGMDWAMDQTVPVLTTGAYGTLGTVNGANQSGTSLTVSALNGPLNKGDVISVAGVFGVNRVTKNTTGQLAQFAVTANVPAGATSIPIYPALTPGAVQYQTVTNSPANGATLTVATKASEVYRSNFVFSPQAVTMATADLELPRGVHEAARENFDGISMRMVTAYNVTSDQFITRLDILYGYQWTRPEWAVRVADSL